MYRSVMIKQESKKPPLPTDFCLDTGERFIGDRQIPSRRVDIFFAFAALGFLLKSLPLVLDHRLENQKMQVCGFKRDEKRYEMLVLFTLVKFIEAPLSLSLAALFWPSFVLSQWACPGFWEHLVPSFLVLASAFARGGEIPKSEILDKWSMLLKVWLRDVPKSKVAFWKWSLEHILIVLLHTCIVDVCILVYCIFIEGCRV